MTQHSVASDPVRDARHRLPLPPGVMLGFVVAVLAILVTTFFSYRSLQERSATSESVSRTLEVLGQVQKVLSAVKDAETGQRGYLLTGSESYLEPYTTAQAALPSELKRLRQLVGDSPQQQRRLEILERDATDKMQELAQTVDLRRSGDSAGALALVRTNRGRNAMDRIVGQVREMEGEERRLLAERQERWHQAELVALFVMLGGSALLLGLISASAWQTLRTFRERDTETWLRAGQAQLSQRLQGDQRLDTLGDNILEMLARLLDAQIGAVHVREGETLRRVAGFALAPEARGVAGTALLAGDGLVGQAAKENRTLRVRDVPDDYFAVVASSLGRAKARELLVVPASIDGVVQGVVELGFFRSVSAEDEAFLARASESLGVAVRSSKDRSRLEALLEETQRQSEELQAQQEELRVNNEELEEQSRALKESQAQLQSQQAELEQINSHLEEQTQLLEAQKDALAVTQVTLTEKAGELERSNQYKSEFLANMSHELRTPLNSTLILARLLADNKDGNLSAEQVKFAETISAAGNDLLALINDILDLSKIEAGKAEVVNENVRLGESVAALARTLEPLAREKGLDFSVEIASGTPDKMETDGQRLAQILKNLLSNAIKFTAKGQVALRVASAEGTVSFAVHDSGIGIPEDQQAAVFEAFRQADGSTHRKYGGTGLGLSISRDLARLLGGEVALRSRPGEGSVFTLTLPLVPGTGSARPAPAPAPAASRLGSSRPVAPMSQRPQPVEPPGTGPVMAAGDRRPGDESENGSESQDDRDRLSAQARLILVIEDDVRFAAILRDLANEMGFQCVVTHSANDGLAAAVKYRPSAILLDMNLPDHSGLGVLDQLKRNPHTRHIPVHVASVADYSQEALELGAIGYALKPVKREQLVDALHRLEAKFSQVLRRVLVVEDDERQRQSIVLLLASEEVEITTAESAVEALAQLKATTFDCVVMDLNLPDLSGYQLLEKMAEQEEVSFPPVIVYTGRSLSRDEEQELRRFSKSIIIKDARSPERLLDEVTLFLHQVESKLPPERQRMLKLARGRDVELEGRRILVVEDDVRNIFALSSVLEPKGVKVEIARNGREAIEFLGRSSGDSARAVDLVLMDIMMPEMDGFTAMREIRKRPEWAKLPIIALTAKAMRDDQEKCLAAGANDYIAKPLDVEKLLSLVRVWMPK